MLLLPLIQHIPPQPAHRKSRHPQYSAARSVASQSTVYEEEEEGYVSGNYEDALFELVKIQVKVLLHLLFLLKPSLNVNVFFSFLSYTIMMKFWGWMEKSPSCN
jgi:hypothetical protein